MNQKFKIKMVALVATLSGTAFGNCQAMQQGSGFMPQPVSGVVRPVEPAVDGSFGAVRLAEPLAGYQSQTQLPPVVSANGMLPTQPSVQSAAMPPIVTPAQAQPSKRSVMLAPIALPKAPELVAQATSVPVDSSNDNQVVPAAQWQQQSQNRAPAQMTNGLSSAGIPIYGSRSGNQSNLSAPRPTTAPIISTGSQIYSPVDNVVPAVPSYEQSYASKNIPIDNYAQPTPAPTYFDGPPASTYGATDSYGTSNGYCADCGGTGCANCGSPGSFDPDFVTDQYGICGSVSSARRYLVAEALYFNRTDGDIVNSNFGGLGSFNADLGWRLTIGQRRDATQGTEFSYMGSVPLSDEVTRTDALGRMRTIFGASTFFASAEASPFFNSVFQNERKETQLHSVEFNKVSWGWDVVKSFYGFRYIYVDDQYSLISQNIAGETGTFSMGAKNNLIGPHVGRELFYDVGYRMSFSGFGKAGIYANISEFKGQASKLGTTFIDGKDDNVTIAGSLELGLLAHYQLNSRSRLRAGYNALWLGNVSSVSDNLPGTLSPFFGTSAGDSDDMFFHGLLFGLEFYR